MRACSAVPPFSVTDEDSLAPIARGHYQRAVQALRDGDWVRFGEEFKKLWAEARLHADEPGLHMTKWHWLATGGIHIPATTPQARALAKAGIARPQKVILEL